MKPQTAQISQWPLSLDHLTRSDLHDYFTNSWHLYEWLYSSVVSDDVWYSRSDPLRHPQVFYFGHTAAFYVNKLLAVNLLEEGVDAHLDDFLARGVDPESASDLSNQVVWPTLEQVISYRNEVFRRVERVINQIAISLPITAEDPLWALLMAIEHERIHFETSSVLIRQYPTHMLRRPVDWQYAPMNQQQPEQTFVPIETGKVELGRGTQAANFGWDNEYGQLSQEVPGFEASVNLITNANFLEFVAEGGYQERRFWCDAGWQRKEDQQHPCFWVKTGDTYGYRAMFDVLEMPWDWPVEVSAFEAEAYCRFKGENWQLPSEAQYQRMVAQTVRDDEDVFQERFNLNMKYGSPTIVGSQAGATSPSGICDPYGNVWQWLSSDFYPLPDFNPHPLYPDFSEPYFTQDHGMMLGGSWATTGTAASRFYRLWFRRHFIQHAGFRPVRESYGHTR